VIFRCSGALRLDPYLASLWAEKPDAPRFVARQRMFRYTAPWRTCTLRSQTIEDAQHRRRDEFTFHALKLDVLGPVYGWFTEGFDTPVLKDAKTLLDELA
jgi:hypothetical protein